MDCKIANSTFTPPKPALNLSTSRPPPKLQLPRWKPSRLKKRLAVSKSCGGASEADSGSEFVTNPGKIFMEEAIGAEYGEGFETFRMDGPLKVDVDYLNEKLQGCFLQRIRHSMKPDEAFGLIFSWDNVVADTRSLKLDAWRQLALEIGRDFPNDAHVQRTILHAAPDYALQKLSILAATFSAYYFSGLNAGSSKLLFWASDCHAEWISIKVLCWEKHGTELDKLKSRILNLYYENFLRIDTPMDGLKEWLDALYTAGVPCAVVSCLDRRNMLETLERMGLNKYFQAFVTEEDGMESIAHRFLSAAVKLDRKPSKCVVFEDDPRGVTAAHNCTMMAVALIGAHRAYELVQADLAVSSFSELTVINLKRLFANKGTSFMDLQKQIIEQSPPKRRLMIDTIF